MINGLWGKKIGMTQVFHENKVVPVTVIDVAHWYVTQIKTQEKDGYQALQLGLIRPRYQDKQFSADWLKNPAEYFALLREVGVSQLDNEIAVGQVVDPKTLLGRGDTVDVFGITKGCGFQGVVKRLGWAGGKASHGSKFGRIPGTLGTTRRSGRVRKGHGLPGHMGTNQRPTLNLEIVDLHEDVPVLLVKGSVPGKSGTLLFLRKRG